MKTWLPLILALVVALPTLAVAEEAKKEEKPGVKVKFADEKLEMVAPADWKKVEPRVRIIELEFAIEPAEGDKAPGRLTLMGAGGSIKANIDRWKGQFTKLTKDNVDEEKVEKHVVHFVELQGDYKDQRGPFAPAVVKNGYTMLAAIVVTDELGQYFVKFYGPDKTVAANKEKFMKMIKSLKSK